MATKQVRHGSFFYPLSEQIKDSALAHGVEWARWHYTEKKGGPQLAPLEWDILSRAAIKAASIELLSVSV
jgi:hypothetical protein